MRQPPTATSSLRQPVREMTDQILAQLQNHETALQGIEVTVVDRDVSYQQGEATIRKERQEQWTIGRELPGQQNPNELVERLSQILSGSSHTCQEIPTGSPDELHLRLMPRRPMGFGQFLETEDVKIEEMDITAVLSTTTPRLLRLELEPPDMSWSLHLLMKLAFKAFSILIEFEQVRGVPVPALIRSRIQSRGLGPWRMDQGSEVEFQYEDWPENSALRL